MSDGFERSEFENKENNLNMEDFENGNTRSGIDRNEGQEKTEESIQENAESIPSQGNGSGSQGREDDSQGQKIGEEAPNDEEEIQKTEEKIDQADNSFDDGATQAQSSWSHTASSQKSKSDAEREKKRRRKRSLGIGLIAVIVALTLAVTSFGGFIGMFAVDALVWIGKTMAELGNIQIEYGASDNDNNADSSGVGASADDLDVTKNDGSILINEQIGSTGNEGDMTIADVVREMGDTVVKISVKTYDRYDRLISTGTGSGVIIDSDGYIITNKHVVEGATVVYVEVPNKGTFDAALVGWDKSSDVALIKINASGLPAAVLGHSGSLVVGQEVIAVGYPLGSGMTVTNGIISALDRQVTIDGISMSLLQTNAAINPGNSGGALFDRAGQLIGIVNAKQVDTDIEGLGFAIPIDTAWGSVERIVDKASSISAA